MMKWLKSSFQNAIIFVAGIITSVLISDVIAEQASFGGTLFYFLLIVFMLLIVFFTAKIRSDVQDMVIAIGTRVRYIGSQWKDKSARSGEVFEEIRKIMQEADHEILIAGHNDPYFDPKPSEIQKKRSPKDPSQEKRLFYLETIETKLNEVKDKPFQYIRIIQMPNADKIQINESALGSVEFNHCQNVLNIRARSSSENIIINVMKMDTERTLSFIIVDEKYLIISDPAKRNAEQGRASYISGAFIIEDFNGSLVGGFRRYFMGYLVPLADSISQKDFFDQPHQISL